MSDACPNCGAARTGPFCSACGQNDRMYLVSAPRLVREAVETQLGLDSRLLRTLRALLTRPGYLTNEFVRDKRARYLSPVRLYLFVSVAFFFLSSVTGTFDFDIAMLRDDEVASSAGKPDEDFLAMYSELSTEERSRVRSLAGKGALVNDATRARMDALDTSPAPARDATPLERRVRERLLSLFESPGVVGNAVAERLPIALFLTLPFYAAFLKLMYLRRYYAEHFVFALHLHAFLFVLGAVMVVMPENVIGEVVIRALQLAGGVYYFIALRRVYAEAWFRTVVKFLALNALHATLVVVAILLTTFVTLIV